MNTPTTGVIHNNTAQWLHEDIFDGIDLAYEEHVSECPNEYHDLCWESDPSDTILVGDWKQNDDGLWEIDQNGPKGYAGICGEIYTQVVWSKATKRCALCSPCYPGQGDLDTPVQIGGVVAYDLPADVYGEV